MKLRSNRIRATKNALFVQVWRARALNSGASLHWLGVAPSLAVRKRAATPAPPVSRQNFCDHERPHAEPCGCYFGYAKKACLKSLENDRKSVGALPVICLTAADTVAASPRL